MANNHDLAIRWNDRISSLRKVKRAGGVSVYGFPHHLRCPGGGVAIVFRNNEIKLVFRAVSIDGPQRVKLADGQSWRKGYFIRSDRRTMRQPRGSIKAPFRGWYAIGALRYFNAAKMQALLVGDNFGSPDNYIDDVKTESSGIVFRPHIQGVPGLPRAHPEPTLVDQYVSWMGLGTRFGHNYIREVKLSVDLFDLTQWQLIEAKATTNREAIRMALGQLRDYKRFYHGRHPSLGVLLPLRPSNSCIKLLSDNHIATIWRTPGGRFSTRRWQDMDE